MLDYGARHYDPIVARFTTIDNSAESYEEYSLYVYVGNNPIRRVDLDGNDWGDIVKGVFVAVVDNATGANGRGRVSYNNGADYNRGQDIGDGLSIIAGGLEAIVGGGTAAGGVGVSVGSGGTLAVAGLPAAAAGTTMMGHGVMMGSKGASNLSSQKGRVNEFGGKNDTNSKSSKEAYRNAKDQNGIPRSQQPDKTTSVREKGTGKPLKPTEYTNSKGEKVQIRKDNPKTYPDEGQHGNHYNAGEAGKKLDQHHNY